MNGRDFECSLGVRLSERGSDLHSVIEKVSKKMSEREFLFQFYVTLALRTHLSVRLTLK